MPPPPPRGKNGASLSYVIGEKEDGTLFYVHRLVYELGHGPIPQGHDVRHKNGNTLDNRCSNLELYSLK